MLRLAIFGLLLLELVVMAGLPLMSRVSEENTPLSTEKAQRLLGYQPIAAANGTYFDESVMW